MTKKLNSEQTRLLIVHALKYPQRDEDGNVYEGIISSVPRAELDSRGSASSDVLKEHIITRLVDGLTEIPDVKIAGEAGKLALDCTSRPDYLD